MEMSYLDRKDVKEIRSNAIRIMALCANDINKNSDISVAEAESRIAATWLDIYERLGGVLEDDDDVRRRR